MGAGNIVAEYIWIDGYGNLRSKARTLSRDSDSPPWNDISYIPEWNYDGSSTKQADGDDSEILIKPCAIYKCPFRIHKEESYTNILVLCDTYKPNGDPHSTNNRYLAKEIFDKNIHEKPWYGLEQEYFLINKNTNLPLGMKKDYDNTLEQGHYYCGVGSKNSYGRNIIDQHYEACLFAGLKVSGVNAEVAPGQWEYQIGPVEGIEAADQLYIARYIMERITENYDVIISIHPKPIPGHWNGSGCHTNFSTEKMRQYNSQCNGLDNIHAAIKKLSSKHKEHMIVYGKDNQLRMTGKCETASYDQFSYGVGDRGASIRIPNSTYNDKCGYFEDRRPSSNMDPYLVTSIILKTITE